MAEYSIYNLPKLIFFLLFWHSIGTVLLLVILSHRFNVQPFRWLRRIALDVQVGEPYAVVMRHCAGGDLPTVHEELGGTL